MDVETSTGVDGDARWTRARVGGARARVRFASRVARARRTATLERSRVVEEVADASRAPGRAVDARAGEASGGRARAGVSKTTGARAVDECGR